MHKGEVPASRALKGEMRLQSDHKIARRESVLILVTNPLRSIHYRNR